MTGLPHFGGFGWGQAWGYNVFCESSLVLFNFIDPTLPQKQCSILYACSIFCATCVCFNVAHHFIKSL